MSKGWKNEYERHSLAAQGIKTSRAVRRKQFLAINRRSQEKPEFYFNGHKVNLRRNSRSNWEIQINGKKQPEEWETEYEAKDHAENIIRKNKSIITYPTQPKYERYPIDEVIRKNKSLGHHFFDADAKRFFSSRIPQDAFRKGDTIYFITSEQFEDRMMNLKEPRKYTIREADFNTGEIKIRPTESEGIFKFQNFNSKSSARNALNKVLNE